MATVASSREEISSNLTCAVFCLSGCHGSPRAVASRCHAVTGAPVIRHRRRRRQATADGKMEVDRLCFVCDVKSNDVYVGHRE